MLFRSPKQVAKGQEREKMKIIVAFRSHTTRNRKLQKNSKKIRKTKQYHYDFISSQNRLDKAEKVKKYKLSFHSFSTRRVIENSKKIAKKLKKLNNIIIASFQAKIGWKTQRKRENKNCHSVSFRTYPTRNRKFQKNSKKFQQCHYVIISSQNRLENVEKERI